MLINQEAIKTILDIEEKVHTTPSEMADKLNITFFPYDKNKIKPELLVFARKIEQALLKYKANIVPFEETLESNYLFLFRNILKGFLSYFFYHIIAFIKNEKIDPLIPNPKALFSIKIGKKIKKGIAIIAIGENKSRNLPIDYTSSFVKNQIITIIEMPNEINSDSDFHAHFDTALKLFTKHMTHIVLAVSKTKWILYNMNASHPIYEIDDKDFDLHILNGLIPKIYAPIKPPKFSDFIIRNDKFNPNNSEYKIYIDDIISSGYIFEKTKLYPPGKNIEELPFKNDLYKWIGHLFLDGRNGMSYGFLARQIPSELSSLIPFEQAKEKYRDYFQEDNSYFMINKEIYLIVEILNEKYCLKVPDIWVLTQRSGAKKTEIKINDIIKIGLVNGNMIMDIPIVTKINTNYKPSFDTRVILSHAVGNAIIASVLNHFNPGNSFSENFKKNGIAIAHWHGYFKDKALPDGFVVYGEENPHVPCSAPQSAIYALRDKIKNIEDILKNNLNYLGDVHVEPNHGININFSTLNNLGSFIENNPEITVLGNKYLKYK